MIIQIVIVSNEAERRDFIKEIGEEALPEEYGGRSNLIALQDVTLTPLEDWLLLQSRLIKTWYTNDPCSLLHCIVARNISSILGSLFSTTHPKVPLFLKQWSIYTTSNLFFLFIYVYNICLHLRIEHMPTGFMFLINMVWSFLGFFFKSFPTQLDVDDSTTIHF